MTTSLHPAVYERAERLLPANVRECVVRDDARPVWFGKNDQFWYRTRVRGGGEFVLVDPDRRRRSLAFDHARMARALAESCGVEVDPAALPLQGLELDGADVVVRVAGQRWRCRLDDYSLERVGAATPESTLGEVCSPDGSWAAFVRDHDVWVRNLASGEDRCLTRDGEQDHSYGTPPDMSDASRALAQVGLTHPPVVAWSPDSRRILTHRLDQRDVATLPFVNNATDGARPTAETLRIPFPQDPAVPTAEPVVLDVESGLQVRSKAEPLAIGYLSPLLARQMWWAIDGSKVYWIAAERGDRAVRLQAMDPDTGEVDTLLEERGPTMVDVAPLFGTPPVLHIIEETAEVVWWSQRDGWGHLHLVDAHTGAPIRQLTSGPWQVREIVHVDESQRTVLFTAAGVAEGSDPYIRGLYEVSLGGGAVRTVIADGLDHEVEVSPTGRYLIDHASRWDSPPVTTLRDRSGTHLLELERADISGLLEAGWRAPQRFTAKAADGVTDLYGLLYLPDPDQAPGPYPLLDDIYPGPQVNRVAPAFLGVPPMEHGPVFAALGFAVVALDGRGTPLRSKAFHDVSYGDLGSAGSVEDHVAVIAELGRRHPELDVDRVGIFGHSAGGFAAARAVCQEPDVFKVAIASAGNHDQRVYHACWGEKYGAMVDPDRPAEPQTAELAHQLVGKLLIIHGEADDNVHLFQTWRLVDGLVKANKDFDLLVLPGNGHGLTQDDGYFHRRRWDYFVRHLLGAEPPAGYRVASSPMDLSNLETLLS